MNMFKKDKKIETPNGNTIIWRYMGIDKFLHLITSKQLFFTRLSKMTDKYEGSLPDEILHKIIQQIHKETNGDPFDRIIKKRREFEKFKDFTFINCWAKNRNESYALWKIYLRGSSSGVAIKSTVGKLRKSLESQPDNFDFYIGDVKYNSVNLELPPTPHQLTLLKKPYYEFENEVRVFFDYDEEFEKRTPLFSETPGWALNIDIEELIDSIYISPFSGKWFEKPFREILNKIDKNLAEKTVSSKIRDE